MKILVRDSDNFITHSFANNASVVITETRVEAPGFHIGFLNSGNCQLVEGVTLPTDFTEKNYLYVEGSFIDGGEMLRPGTLDKFKTNKVSAVVALKDEKRDGGFTYGGVFIETDTQARSLLLGEKMAGTGDVNFYSRNGTLVSMTRAEFDTFYSAFHAFLKAVEENAASLIASIQVAATKAEIQAIDIESGWP